MQGIKRKRRCQNQCEEHLFSLINLKNNPKYDIKLTFCPKYQRQPLPPQHTYAEYNDDWLYYTSAFVLGVDKKQISKNLQKQMLDHQKLIKQNCQKYNQIIFPRPNSKHIKCSVCKEDYKNYYQHIFSDQHSQKIQSSGYNNYIKQLCELFKDFWHGCEQKADNQAKYSNEKSKLSYEKNQDEQLNQDQLPQEQIIQQGQFQNQHDLNKSISEEKQIVMKRHPRMTARPVERTIQPPFSQKNYEDRQSRKKNIDFRQYFIQDCKKKFIDDNRQAITLTKKSSKQGQTNGSKTKPNSEIASPNKKQQIHQDDPFTIEHNARSKKKQKKSYYYIKKKQREQRQQRQRQLMLEINQDQNQNHEEINNQIQENNFLPSQQIQQKKQKQLPKQYHDHQMKNQKIKQKQKQFNRFNIDPKANKAKENQLFQVIDKKSYQTNLQQKNNIFQNIQPNKNVITTNAPIKDTIKMQLHFENNSKRKLQNHFKPSTLSLVPNSQRKQQYLQKNKKDQQEEYNLPLHHRFRRYEKQTTKQRDSQFSKVNKQIFNDYQEKLKQYNQQKNYYKRQGKHEQKNQLFPHDQSTVRMAKSFQQSNDNANQTNQRHLFEQGFFNRSAKSQSVNNYKHFEDNYYKKNIDEKSSNPLAPPNVYSDHPIYNAHLPYAHGPAPIPGYAYHQMGPHQRQMQKDGRIHTRRPREMYEYQHFYQYVNPYYSHPPSQIPLSTQIPPPITGIPRQHQKPLHKQYQQPLNKSLQKKPYVAYSSYPSYIPPYPPQYYPPTQPPFPSSPYVPSSSRQSPNTSIHINLPMCMPPNYPNQNYNYQPRYQEQRQYQQGQQGQQGQQQQGQHGQSAQLGFTSRQRSTLMPYAEYQEYKKRTMN